MQIDKPRNGIRYKDKDFSGLIDVRDKQGAYFIGLLFSDGYISSRGSLTLTLKQSDSEILYALAEYVNLPADAIRAKRSKGDFPREPQLSLIMCSRDLVRGVEKYGIVKNKTKNGVPYTFPENEELALAFLHGWLDGDGCVAQQCSIIMSTHQQAEALCSLIERLGGKPVLEYFKIYPRVRLNKSSNLVLLRKMFSQDIKCISRKRDSFYSVFNRGIIANRIPE